MHKVGEGKNPQKPQGVDEYRKSLQNHCSHFLEALRKLGSSTDQERDHWMAAMRDQLSLILSDVSELKRAGISKEASFLQKAFRSYESDPSEENVAALEHHVATLCEFNC